MGGCITYDGDSVVEERLAEDDDVEQLVDVDGLEDGEHGDGVDGGEQRREDERVQQRQTDRVAEHARLTESPQRQTDQKRVRLHHDNNNNTVTRPDCRPPVTAA